MSFINPNDSTEILYGSSGDVRDEINAYVLTSTAGHYADETELPGKLIVNSLRRSTRLINGYLQPSYADQIPYNATGDVPKLLDEISSELSIYFALRSISAKVAGTTIEEKKRDYYDAYLSETSPQGILVLIRDRKVQLSELFKLYPDEVKAVRAQGRAPVFDLDKETNWVVDPRLDEDIQRERNN